MRITFAACVYFVWNLDPIFSVLVLLIAPVIAKAGLYLGDSRYAKYEVFLKTCKPNKK